MARGIRLISNQRHQHVIRRTLLAAAVLLAATGFILAVPFLLLAIGHIRHTDWTQFSSEAQTYGGIAAVFGMLALVGVAASLVLQSRETAANRELTQRTIHSDLLSRALDDPELHACWGPSLHGDVEHDRQHLYTNMIVQFWRSMFEMGKITPYQLGALSARMFTGAPGRRYWSIAGPFQKSHYLTDLDRKFVEILDEEHAKAKVKTPVAGRLKPTALSQTSIGDRSTIVTLTLGIVGGVVLSRAAAAARRRNHFPMP
jgi:hypothetical protein